MLGYDNWKTRSPDDDVSSEEPSQEQQQADYEDEMQQQNVGCEPAISDKSTQDIRWATNVLLETIAAKFEANETMDIWRSDAAALVRSFKHDLAPKTAQDDRCGAGTAPIDEDDIIIERGIPIF